MKPCQVISGKLLSETKRHTSCDFDISQNVINDLKPLQSVGD